LDGEAFVAFDLLWLDGRDWRDVPPVEPKRRPSDIIPTQPSNVLYVRHVASRGSELFRIACDRDLQGIVAKWAQGRYADAARRWSDGAICSSATADQISDRRDACRDVVPSYI